MTVAALREELQREEAVWALGEFRRAKEWERWELAAPLVAAHLPPGTAVRMGLRLMPDWYRNLWPDPTQIDGRALLSSWDRVTVRIIGITPENPHDAGTVYSVEVMRFLDAVLAGDVGDAS